MSLSTNVNSLVTTPRHLIIIIIIFFLLEQEITICADGTISNRDTYKIIMKQKQNHMCGLRRSKPLLKLPLIFFFFFGINY